MCRRARPRGGGQAEEVEADESRGRIPLLKNYMPLLSREDITAKLKHLLGWELDEQFLRKEFVFPTFADAMIFVNEVAQAAEDMEHHPDFFIHHNTVKLSTTTYDLMGVTEKDIALAEKAQEAEKLIFGDLGRA